jgi:hypothetical protein
VSESERLASGDSGVQSVPYRLQDWYDRHMEYLAAPRFFSRIMCRYTFDKGIYLEMDVMSVNAYRLNYLTDKNRLSATIKVGYDF